MSRETDFLVLYPYLVAVWTKASTLVQLLDEVCSLEEGPDSGWIAPLHEACQGLTLALEADAIKSLEQIDFSGLREAMRLVELSFDEGEGLLFDALTKTRAEVEPLEEHIQILAERAFGTWSAHFCCCAPTLSPDYFRSQCVLHGL